MLTWIQPLMSGAAVKIILTPPAGAKSWRILRRTADAFTGHDDAGAVLVHDGHNNAVLDIQALVNGVAYHYHAYWFDGAAWHDGGGAVATPAYTVEDLGADVLTLLRDRVAAGLAAEVATGRLHHPKGRIQALTAPPKKDETVLPVVTLQLSTDGAADRVVGDDLLGFVPGDDEYTEWGESEGWLSRVRVDLMVWSLNPDERNQLRRAVKRIVMANLAVFSMEGLSQVQFDQSDLEDFESFNAPMYQDAGAFTCLAPAVVVGGEANVIRDIPVTVNSSV